MARHAPTARARSPRRGLLVALGLLLLLGTTVSCGASIQALYEGDVRFEHCMALDARPDVGRPLREICWGEWVAFYTFGQTSDRIEYARMRKRQLAVDFRPDEPTPPKDIPTSSPAVPEPTSVLVPPPMMLTTDAGPADAEADAAPDASSQPPPPNAECAADCAQSFRACQQGCKSAPCEKSCAAKYKRCMHRCF